MTASSMGRLLAFLRSKPDGKHEGLWALSAVLAGALCFLIVVAIDLAGRPADITNSDVAFQEGGKKPNGKGGRAEAENRVDWPLYGYNLARTKNLDVDIGPPLRQTWSWDSKELIEFSPIVVDGKLYGMNNDALFFSLDGKTGKVLWKKDVGKLSASSPVHHKGILYATTLEPGQVFALRARDGKTIWSRPLPGRSESSPAVYKGKLILGCECNAVFGLDLKNGKTIWEADVAGSVKAAPAIADNKAYVGDYAGRMYAISTVNGNVVWESTDQGASFGRSGRFYSTPAVAYGRVYAGNVDGRVYSFASSDGETAWTQSVGDFVYSGVVAGTAGNREAVFTGSHDENAYAFDARTGEIIWSTSVDGIVSGSGSIVNDIFYVSILAGETIGLDTRTGKKVFSFPKGEYNPIVSDGVRLYLTGYSSINALEPKRKGSGGKRSKGDKPAKKRG